MRKINTLGISTIFLNLIVSPFLGLGIYFLIKFSSLNSIISILLSLIISIFILYFIISIFNYENKLNLKEKIFKTFSKTNSYIIIITICLLLFILSIIYAYDFNNFVISQFLSETPIFIVGLLFTILAIFTSKKNIEIISQISVIIFFINLVLFILALLGNFKGFHLDNLMPITYNINSITKGCLYLISLCTTPSLMILIIPKDNIIANSKTNKWLYISIILGFVFMIIVTTFTVGILGINLTQIYQYPSYMVLKRSSLFGFLDRVENFIFIQWIFQIYLSISFILYFIKKTLKIDQAITGLSMLILSLIFFKNNTFYYEFSRALIPIIGFGLLLLLVIIFIKIKRKCKLSQST